MYAFLHGSGLDSTNHENCVERSYEASCCERTFDGLRIDTCANRTFVLGRFQYHRYCETFNFPSIINSSRSTVIYGIGGSNTSVGIVLILVPFKYMDLIVDISFLVIEENVPTLVSMEDMLANDLDISIQWKYMSLGERRHPSTKENYFLVQKRCPSDGLYALHTEHEL